MQSQDVLVLGQEAIFVLLKMTLPILLAALVVGLVISLFQALTQIQEMTLTFIPKILAIFIMLLLYGPVMGNLLNGYAMRIFDQILSV